MIYNPTTEKNNSYFVIFVAVVGVRTCEEFQQQQHKNASRWKQR